MMSSSAVLDRVDNPRVGALESAPSIDDQRVRPCRLVMLIGGLSDEAGVRQVLNRAGIRLAAANSPEIARSASTHVLFDAVMVNATVLQSTRAQGVAQLRSWFRGPLLVVDCPGDERDDIDALVHGADVCVRHGASAALLQAHLLSQFKLRPASHLAVDDDDLSLPDTWRFDGAACALRRDDQEVPLTRQQLGLLQCLAQPFGRVVARGELEAKVSPDGRALKRHTIEVYIGRLRLRLLEAGFDAFRIEAVRGRGYRLRAKTPQTRSRIT